MISGLTYRISRGLIIQDEDAERCKARCAIASYQGALDSSELAVAAAQALLWERYVELLEAEAKGHG